MGVWLMQHKQTKAEKAVVTTITRMVADPRLASLIGPGTQIFEELSIAYADIIDKPTAQTKAEIGKRSSNPV